MTRKNNITRTMLIGLVGLTLIGGLVAGCQLFNKDSSSLTAPTAETVAVRRGFGVWSRFPLKHPHLVPLSGFHSLIGQRSLR